MPYPVAVGRNYMYVSFVGSLALLKKRSPVRYFMLDMVAQPIEHYAKLSERKLADA